jgi:hypothetical protein
MVLPPPHPIICTSIDGSLFVNRLAGLLISPYSRWIAMMYNIRCYRGEQIGITFNVGATESMRRPLRQPFLPNDGMKTDATSTYKRLNPRA